MTKKWANPPFIKSLSKEEGYVYVAECDTGHVKIGKSKTPHLRIKHFDTIMPVSVRVVSWFYADNYTKAESFLHKYLARFRVSGEWFDLPEIEYFELKDIFCYIDESYYLASEIFSTDTGGDYFPY